VRIARTDAVRTLLVADMVVIKPQSAVSVPGESCRFLAGYPGGIYRFAQIGDRFADSLRGMGSAFEASRIPSATRHEARIVGRERHLSALASCASTARTGEGRIVVVHGDSGYGKTALVHAFLARECDWSVASALGDDSDCAAPYGVLEQLADDLVHGGAAFMVDRVALWDRGMRGCADALLAAIDAIEGPVCLVVDDAQWVDDDSAGVLMLVAQAVRHRPVLVILAARRGRSPLLNRARRIADDPLRGAVVHVDALQPPEVRQLVEDVLDIDYPVRAAAVLAEYTRGCPLDILAAIEAMGADPARAGQLVRHVPNLVDSVRAVLLQVSDACRRGIELMAVLDAPTSVAELDAAAAHLGGPVDVPAALRVDLIELENVEGVLTVRPPHVRIRDAVLASMGGDAIRAAHAAVANVASGHRALLHRAASFGDGNEDFAAHLDRQAANARVLGDLDRAVEYGLWSVRLSTDPGAQRRRLLACAAGAVSGRHLRVFDELVEGIEALPSEPERDLLLAYAQLRRGDTDTARAYSAGALVADLGGAAEPTALRVVITCELAAALAAMGDMAGLAALCDVLERDLATIAAERSQGRAVDGAAIDLTAREIELFALRSALGHYTEGIPVHGSPVAGLLAQVAPERYGSRHAIALITRGTLLHKDGRLRAALDDLTCGLSLVDDDSSWVAQQGRIELAMVQFRLGDWDDAERTAAESLDVALDLGDPWSTAPAYAVAALVPVGRGQFAIAERRLGLAHTSLSGAGTLLAYRAIALAEVLLSVATHRPDRALSAMRIHRVHDDVGDRVGNWDAAEAIALLVSGRVDEALAILERSEGESAEHLLVRGAASFVVGERARGAGQLQRALAAVDADSSVIIKGVTWQRVGMFLVSDGEPELGESLIRRARDLYERLGATLWLAECEAALTSAVHRARTRDRSTDPRGPDTVLTAREREVAQLVGEGLTNREVAEQLTLSIRTVDFHLRNVLHKLGFGSRRQLRGWSPRHRRPMRHSDHEFLTDK